MADDAGVSVAEILFSRARDTTSTAIVWGSHQRTYAQLHDRARAIAGALQRAGLVAGDRVAVHLLNRGETFELYFACAYAGLTLVPINFRLTAREISSVLEDSGARILFTQVSIADVARAAAPDLQTVVLAEASSGPTYEALADGEPSSGRAHICETHLLLFTSGTTGRPKAVRLTHMNIMWLAWQQVQQYGLDRTTVALLVAPTFNQAGINIFSIPTLLVGGTVVIQPSLGWQPAVLTDLVEKWQVTHTIIFPSQFKALLSAAEDNSIGFESLRMVATGGESSSAELLRQFRKRWPHIRLLQGYGQTETGIVTICADDDMARHATSIGRVVVGTSCRIIGTDGQELPPGKTGELVVRGPSVSPGYWNAPDVTEASFRDGWFATGDLGRREADGLLYLSGRSKDVIISKAQNVYPAEVEHALLDHMGIAEVAVVGVPDEVWGEAVTAAVVRAPGSALSDEDVVSFAREMIASYKKPRHVVFVDELPRNGAGKVDRPLLASRLETALRS